MANEDGFEEDDGFLEDGFIEDTSPQKRVSEQVFTPLAETAALTGAGMMASRLAPTAAGLGMRGAAPLAIPLMGLVGGGIELSKMATEAIESSPNAPKTSLEALSRLGGGAWRGVSGEILGQGLGAGLKALGPSKQVVAQGVRAMTGVPEKATTRVLRDPGILSGPGKKEAGRAYGEMLENLNIQGGEEGVRQTFGRSVLSKEKLFDLFDDYAPQMKDGNLTLQTSFSLRKAMSDEIANVPMQEKETLRRLGSRIAALDEYIEAKMPEWGGVRKAYADAMAGQEFQSWLPLNKNLSPNVLRTAGALATSVKSAAEGGGAGMLALPAVSPRIYGYGIRAGSAVAPVIGGAAEVGSRAAGQATSGYILNSTEELLRKKYQEQK